MIVYVFTRKVRASPTLLFIVYLSNNRPGRRLTSRWNFAPPESIKTPKHSPRSVKGLADRTFCLCRFVHVDHKHPRARNRMKYSVFFCEENITTELLLIRNPAPNGMNESWLPLIPWMKEPPCSPSSFVRLQTLSLMGQCCRNHFWKWRLGKRI